MTKKISFFNISITRTENKFTRSVFRKNLFKYLQSLTNRLQNKKSLIDTLLHRSYNICSDNARFHQEILFLKSVWLKNSFPLFFIYKCVNEFLDKLFIKKKEEKDTSTKRKITNFYEKISLQVERQIIEIFRTCNKHIIN